MKRYLTSYPRILITAARFMFTAAASAGPPRMALTMVTASVGDTDSLPSTGTGRQLAMAYLQAFKRANFCEYEHAKYEH